MAGFYGADVAELRALSRGYEQQSQEITAITLRLGTQIMNSSMWMGPDADRFRAEWSGTLLGLLKSAALALEAAASALQVNAADQEDTSSGGISGPTGGSTDWLKDVLSRAPHGDPVTAPKDTTLPWSPQLPVPTIPNGPVPMPEVHPGEPMPPDFGLAPSFSDRPRFQRVEETLNGEE
jgi:hypothetical protein